jgi:predicted transcriptional regulator
MSASGSSWRGVGQSRYLGGLGALEAEVMRIVWSRHSVTVRDVYEELRLRRKIAYTTVLTVLCNLAGKGLVNQDDSRLAYVYSPAVTELEVTTAILDAFVARLLGGNLEPLIVYLEQKSSTAGTSA